MSQKSFGENDNEIVEDIFQPSESSSSLLFNQETSKNIQSEHEAKESK